MNEDEDEAGDVELQDLLGNTSERRENEGSHDMLDDLPPPDDLFQNQSGNEDNDDDDNVEVVESNNSRPRRGTGKFHYYTKSVLLG